MLGTAGQLERPAKQKQVAQSRIKRIRVPVWKAEAMFALTFESLRDRYSRTRFFLYRNMEHVS